MTDSRTPLDAALDLFVYAPLGLALTAAEELPKLAAKGRERATNQMTIARMVGQFAVTQGRKQLERRMGPPSAPSTPPDAPGAAPTSPRAPGPRSAPREPDPAASTAPPPAAPPADAVASGTNPAGLPPDVGRTSGAAEGADSVFVSEPPGDVPASNGLAIPAYDSLSASQVVQRLAGLGPDELAAVGAYEEAHRRRRTILTRVRQLQGS